MRRDGVVIMIALSFFNYSVILKLYWLMYIGNLVLLGLVIIMGEEGNGAQRWRGDYDRPFFF